MSLATRCTACGTVFRVVQEQLKISDGWVRCGRCKEVFNATEGLFDLERDSPPDWSGSQAASLEAGSSEGWPTGNGPAAAPAPAWPPASIPAAPASDEARAAAPTGTAGPHGGISFKVSGPVPLPAEGPPPSPMHEIDFDVTSSRPAPGALDAASDAPIPPASTGSAKPADADAPATAPAPEGGTAEAAAPDTPGDAAWTPVALRRRSAESDHAVVMPATATATVAEATAPAPLASRWRDSAGDAPTFVREARARERWQDPSLQRALRGGIVALALLLLFQVTLQFRNGLAAQLPFTRPLLVLGCFFAGCSVGPPRRPEAVQVESSTLTRVGSSADGGDVLKLTVSLSNRENLPVEIPMMDLRLTDAGGLLVVRRSLSARDFGHAATALEPDSETALALQFTTGDRRVTGFTVEIYYP